MTSISVSQEELQAATCATLRAHATSEQAKALVAKLASMVEEHSIATGLRKNKRKTTAGKLEYAIGAFLDQPSHRAVARRHWNSLPPMSWLG
jgi:hypothetical protein